MFDQEQWFGDWSEEEVEKFIYLAKTYGCGDKWGLFSSHIKHRVGYQCANYYRALLSRGVIRDANFKYTSTGAAIYSPNK